MKGVGGIGYNNIGPLIHVYTHTDIMIICVFCHKVIKSATTFRLILTLTV